MTTSLVDSQHRSCGLVGDFLYRLLLPFVGSSIYIVGWGGLRDLCVISVRVYLKSRTMKT